MTTTQMMSSCLLFVAVWFLSGSISYCNAYQCSVSLPQNVPQDSPCGALRKAELSAAKLKYNLKSGEPAHPYMLSDKTPEELAEEIKKDPFIRYYGVTYRGVGTANAGLRETYITQKEGGDPDVKDVSEFAYIGQFMKQTGQAILGENARMPSDHEPFMLEKEKWIEDKYFTQQRLAGGNPMILKTISLDGSVGLDWSKLEGDLNPRFDWEQEVRDVLGLNITLEQAIQERRLYAIRYYVCDGMKLTSEIMDFDSRRSMWRTLSPIALFASVPGTPAELKPVAIQMDYTPDSAVFTPNDGGQWMLAKLNLQATDAAYLQIVEHLVKAHFFMEPFCMISWRTLSLKHPLRQMLQYHCRGIRIPSTFGGPKTINPGWYMHRMFGCGWEGALHMMRAIYPRFTWDITDFNKDINDRGLNDDERIPFFPYRDDGEVILKSIEKFVGRYVNLYYKTNPDVKNDVELQAFANELSIDGKTGPSGGLGKVKGFPAKIGSKSQLKNIVSRMIWQLSPQHAAVDFPMPEYGLYTPNLPSRLYNDTRVEPGTFSILNLPNRNISVWATNLLMNIGRFRWDALCDYGNKLEDVDARQVLYSHYNYLVKKVQPMLEERNRKRYESKDLTYPYFIPRWLPNGIQV